LCDEVHLPARLAGFFRRLQFDGLAVHHKQGLWGLWLVEDTRGVFPVFVSGDNLTSWNY
jgi:hypothetical protein